MKQVILGLLLLQPMSLYDLHKAFQAGISLFYSASFGSIQRSLTQLVEDGLVVASVSPGDPRGKKLHTITERGEAAWRAGMLAPLEGSDTETAMLARVYFLGLLDQADREAAVSLLSARVSADLEALRAVAAELDAMEVPTGFAEPFAFQRATLDYGLRSHELAAEWIAGLPR